MIRTATTADLDRLRTLLANANDAPYDLARVAEEKCFGDGVAGAAEVRVWGDFEGVSVTCGKHLRILAVDRAKRRRGIGSALLADAESRGARVAAAEAGNYFTPGVVDPSFLEHRGWREISRTQNLATTELPNEIPAGVQRATHADRERILDFVHHEFGRAWVFEAAKAFDRCLPTLFFAESNGTIEGFSAHDCNNRGLGFFGPTGVAHAARGHGVGHRLLRASLADLRRLGHERAIIPWTDALGYYEKGCHATVESRFVILAGR